jgi:hypothetical protein
MNLEKDKVKTNKFTNFTVIDPQYQTPEWNADGIFQTWQPISGNYDTSSNFCLERSNNNYNPKNDFPINEKDIEIPSNQTGRGFSGNNKGFFFEDEIVNHVISGNRFNENETNHGKFYAHDIGLLSTMSPPQDRVFRSYSRIGYSYRN